MEVSVGELSTQRQRQLRLRHGNVRLDIRRDYSFEVNDGLLAQAYGTAFAGDEDGFKPHLEAAAREIEALFFRDVLRWPGWFAIHSTNGLP